MKKVILIFTVFIFLTPLLVLAKTDNAVAPTPVPRVNIFDELRNLSARINSFIIPNYSAGPSGFLAALEKKFSGAMNRLNQWLGKAAAELANDSRYAFNRLIELKNYLSGKDLAKSAFEGVKNSISKKFHLFSPQ